MKNINQTKEDLKKEIEKEVYNKCRTNKKGFIYDSVYENESDDELLRKCLKEAINLTIEKAEQIFLGIIKKLEDDYSKGNFKPNQLLVIKKFAKEIKSKINSSGSDNHNYSLVKRTNVTGQTVKGVNHPSLHNQVCAKWGHNKGMHNKTYSLCGELYCRCKKFIPKEKKE